MHGAWHVKLILIHCLQLRCRQLVGSIKEVHGSFWPTWSRRVPLSTLEQIARQLQSHMEGRLIPATARSQIALQKINGEIRENLCWKIETNLWNSLARDPLCRWMKHSSSPHVGTMVSIQKTFRLLYWIDKFELDWGHLVWAAAASSQVYDVNQSSSSCCVHNRSTVELTSHLFHLFRL